MKVQYISQGLRVLAGLFISLLVYSCANIGTPNGGPYDELPPKFISSIPAPNQTNFKGKKIEILFDELIQLDKPSENVIITPPQIQMPVVRASGRKAVVELVDTLKENTTYTIDFTNSLGDNNEKNLLENFTFAFSTGDVLDSLEVSGYLLNASNLEPMPGIIVGLHSNLDDSAFVSIPFDRTSKTNDRGKFIIRNIAPGTYRIFALNDANRDYAFDQPGEEIAFSDSLIIPSFAPATRQDTTWVDSLTIDTIRTVGYTRFMPDDIELRLFKEDFARQYMQGRPDRSQENKFTLRFNAPLDTVPVPVPLNFTPADSAWFYPQWDEGGKAVHYWVTEPSVWQKDTIQVALTYPRSDSLNILRPQTDTLSVVMRRRPEPKKKKKDDEPEPVVFLNMSIGASGAMDIFDTVSVVFDEPVLDLKKELFSLEIKQDTLWEPADFEFFPDTVNSLGYFINRKWRYGEEYRLEVDSAAIYSIYGKWNNKVSQTFKINPEDSYGHLYIHITGINDTVPAFAELLGSNDEPVRKAPVKDGGVLFMDLKPGKYYARLIIDANDNSKWDTGNYADKRQPETVYYYPKEIEIMKNWQIEIESPPWDIQATPFMKQKPMEVTKNKPKEVTKQKRDYKNEGRQTSGSSSSSSSGLGRNISF